MFSTPSCNYLLDSKVFYPYVDQTGEVVAEVAWQKPEPVWLRFNPDKKSPSFFRVRIYINDTLLDLRKHALVKWANTQQWLSPGEVWPTQDHLAYKLWRNAQRWRSQ